VNLPVVHAMLNLMINNFFSLLIGCYTNQTAQEHFFGGFQVQTEIACLNNASCKMVSLPASTLRIIGPATSLPLQHLSVND
jgi:hypothetical protein